MSFNDTYITECKNKFVNSANKMKINKHTNSDVINSNLLTTVNNNCNTEKNIIILEDVIIYIYILDSIWQRSKDNNND